MDGEMFSVCQFFRGDAGHEYEVRHVPVARAVDSFRHLTTSVGARLGTTVRVIITDSGDCINAEWVHGKGITFPPEWVEASKAACEECNGTGEVDCDQFQCVADECNGKTPCNTCNQSGSGSDGDL